MGRLEKRSASSDAETEDSGFGSNHSPPFAKVMKLEDDSIPGVNPWSFPSFTDRRTAFTLSNNLNSSHHHLNLGNNENSCKVFSLRGSLFTGKYASRSRDGRIDLKILAQPEEQHRARYMTEGKLY